MVRARCLVACMACLLLAGFVSAAGLPLATATGTVVSANAETIIIRPRNAEGQFGAAVALKVRGTTHITTLTARKQAGKIVMVQNDAEPRAVRKNQTIAVIFTLAGNERILLSAVVEPASR